MSIIKNTVEGTTPTPSPPQSRRQKRLSKHLQHGNQDRDHEQDPRQAVARTRTATTATSTTTTTSSAHGPSPSSLAPLIPRSLLAMPAPSRLLVASIGNPGPYLSTLHSAGHTVLYALASALSIPLQRSSRDWQHGQLGAGGGGGDDEWTLWASPASMNASGPALATAWRTFVARPGARDPPALVVLHDELELPLGALRVRRGSLSPKGHNGLKSIRDALPGVDYTRIGVGIGRPDSREPGVVAAYVLRKMSREEKSRIEAAAGGVVAELRRLSGAG